MYSQEKAELAKGFNKTGRELEGNNHHYQQGRMKLFGAPRQ